jgi:hypothetical protein
MYTLWWRGSAIEVERPLVAQSGQSRRFALRLVAPELTIQNRVLNNLGP